MTSERARWRESSGIRSALMSGFTATTSQDIIVWPGMNSYTVDLATLTAAPDGGLEPVGVREPWTAGPKRHLRFDPHEFPQPRTFHIEDVKLTAKPVAGGSFTIRFLAADRDGDAATVSLYYDTDTNPGNGKTLIASGIPRTAGQFVWKQSRRPGAASSTSTRKPPTAFRQSAGTRPCRWLLRARPPTTPTGMQVDYPPPDAGKKACDPRPVTPSIVVWITIRLNRDRRHFPCTPTRRTTRHPVRRRARRGRSYLAVGTRLLDAPHR